MIRRTKQLFSVEECDLEPSIDHGMRIDLTGHGAERRIRKGGNEDRRGRDVVRLDEINITSQDLVAFEDILFSTEHGA